MLMEQQQQQKQGIAVMTYALCALKRCQGLHGACSSGVGVELLADA